eukprot:Gb_32014 [translate_table: standard]
MASTLKMEITKFNDQNFDLWKLKMEDLLVDKDQWVAVSGNQPMSMKNNDWEKLERKAKSSIRLCLLDSMLLNVSREATAKDLWDNKTGHLKKQCRVKKVDKGKALDVASSTKMKTSTYEVGDVYLASSSTHLCHDAWLIDSGASFHMITQREWFCEYESYDGGIQVTFNKDSYKIIRGAIMLARGVCTRTLYKLEANIVSDGYNSSTVSEDSSETDRTSSLSIEKTMLWHPRMGHIGE